METKNKEASQQTSQQPLNAVKDFERFESRMKRIQKLLGSISNYSDNGSDIGRKPLSQNVKKLESFENRLERIRMAIGTSHNSGIAKALGIKQQSVAGAIKRRQIPASWFIKISEDFGRSADWLLYGEGFEEKSRLIDCYQEEIKHTLKALISAVNLLNELEFVDNDKNRIPLFEDDKEKLKGIIQKDLWEDLETAIWITIELLMRLFPYAREGGEKAAE